MRSLVAVAQVVSVLVVSILGVVLVSSPAVAACHAFTVSASPADVEEGGTVTVTVSRDAAAAPSSIDVSTVDGTAVGTTDYEPLNETATFPDGGTEQTFTVQTIDREGQQGNRTFEVELSNPEGCAINPNYVVGDPAEVTIVDAPEPDPSPEPSPEPSPDPRPDPDVEDTGDTLPDTGPSWSPIVAVLMAGLALAVIITLRGRRA